MDHGQGTKAGKYLVLITPEKEKHNPGKGWVSFTPTKEFPDIFSFARHHYNNINEGKKFKVGILGFKGFKE
ncbi:hypothetical protein HZC33_01455 [Candidatus Wolfebacteria bacterium]|nr:hypothetical protein [Candidatus Wolfebacteria bacterium]